MGEEKAPRYVRFGGKWESIEFGALARVRDHKIPPDGVCSNTPCVELEHIEIGDGGLNSLGTAEGASSVKHRFEQGDVLFGRLRPYLRKWWRADRSGICSTEIWPLVVREGKADSGFVYGLVQTDRFREAADASYGTHMPRADWRIVSAVKFPLPPLPEQRAIAAVLSDVDELIGSLEALIAKKRAIKQAAMQVLLTGRTRLPGFSGEWETKRLEEIATVTMGQSPPSASYNVGGDGLPLIQGNADIARRSTIDRIWTTLPGKFCGAGDIVLTVRAPVGYVARASKRACLGRGVCGLRPLGHGPFLYYALIMRESHWEDVEQGSTFSAVNSAQVAGFPICSPMDREEQQAIATILSDMDAEIAALERRLDKTRTIKQGMMQQLLTGAIRLPIPQTRADKEADR